MKKQIIVISINVGNAYNFPHRSCVVQNIGCVLMFRIVDIKTAQYQEEDADQHLTNRPLLKKLDQALLVMSDPLHWKL